MCARESNRRNAVATVKFRNFHASNHFLFIYTISTVNLFQRRTNYVTIIAWITTATMHERLEIVGSWWTKRNERVDGERHAHGRWQIDNAWVGDDRLCGDGVSRFDIAFGRAEFDVHVTFDNAHGVCRPCLCRDRMCAYTMARPPRPRALQLDDHYVRTRNDHHVTSTQSCVVSFRVCNIRQKLLA